jgi:hypothetical protein
LRLKVLGAGSVQKPRPHPGSSKGSQGGGFAVVHRDLGTPRLFGTAEGLDPRLEEPYRTFEGPGRSLRHSSIHGCESCEDGLLDAMTAMASARGRFQWEESVRCAR